MSLLLLTVLICLIGWKASSLLKLNHQLSNKIEECQRAEAELERFFDLSIDLFCVAERDGYFKRLNPAFEKTLGYRQKELLSEPFLNFVHPDDRAVTQAEMEKLNKNKATVSFENRYRCQDGEYKWLAWNAFPATGESLIYAVARDITEKKQAEKALRLTQFSVECAADAIFWIDKNAQFAYVNEAACQSLGYSRSELLSMNVADIDTNVPLSAWSQHWEEVKLKQAMTFESIHQSKAAVCFSVEVRVNYLAFDEQEYLCAFAHDISERKQTEKSLEKSQTRLAGILNIAEDAIVSVDAKQIITLFNQGAEKLFGYTCQEVLGQSLDLLLPLRFAEIHRRHLREFSQSSEISRRMGERKEVFGVRQDGREFPAEASISKLELGDEILFTVIVRDITERKQTEKLLSEYNRTLEDQVAERTEKLSQTLKQLQLTQTQLVESEKMAALGSLVAGVAHEINTPLGIGVTASSTLADKTQKFSLLCHSGAIKRSQLNKFLKTAQQSSSIILSNLNRAVELIQSFKQVAVDQSSESRRTFKLKEYLQEILTALRPKLNGTKHTLEIRGDESLILDSYPGALSQIVTNLVLNSLIHAYAREDSGYILIDFQLSCPLYGKGEEIILSYIDDGQGIPPESQSKIFEPFFTTKRGQGGSGLGLHLVYNLVTQKLQGRIECESEVGVGTKFTLTFPAQIIK